MGHDRRSGLQTFKFTCHHSLGPSVLAILRQSIAFMPAGFRYFTYIDDGMVLAVETRASASTNHPIYPLEQTGSAKAGSKKIA
ncbi:hypothetical protein PENFLA_c024G10406 [Penicillium flavigenum]|uniref:Uncharacterized protein n=1 Tax=Penicillium flavigenum TaxID=254877 RepID=A0A1V6STW6_9EURO|nr:hypothetical protein PENFLA_c024G10406 [Penicillium flavigenum]